MGVGFTTIYAISAYHHWSCECESHSWWGVLDTILCDKVCQWHTAGLWFSLGTMVSSTNKTDCHDISEILLKVALKHHNMHFISRNKHCWYMYMTVVYYYVFCKFLLWYKFIRYFGIYHKELYRVDIHVLCENNTSTMPVSRWEGWVFSCLSSYI
jgi:hypothetical protein